MFRRAAICGLGLLGGSIAGAMRRTFPETEILGCDLDPSFVSQAARDGVLDGSFSPGEVPECDLAVVALPVFRSISVLSGILEKSGEGTVVIDTGSVKAPIVDALRGNPGFSKFVPCHPMAGSEQSGYGAARNDLFSGASVIITPHEKTAPETASRVAALWSALGASVISASPAEHDRMVAATSHLPHLLSAALAAAVSSAGKAALPFSGKGLSDMTRLAGGSPALWSEITRMNAENIVRVLDQYRALLDELESSLKRGDAAGLSAFLEKGAASKKELYGEEDRSGC
jgi:prephenate dehydrogenase